MFRDRFGQPVSTASARAAELNDDAVDRLFALQGGAARLIDEALQLDPEFALAHCTKARVLQQQGEPAAARRWADSGRHLAAGLSVRERHHAEIVRLAVYGDSKALPAVRDHADAFPRDAVPLAFALGVYGLLGFGGFVDFHEQQVALLESVAPAWGDEWWFLSALGWAYVEVGRTDDGIALLDKSLALNPGNANAIHGRTHGYYEQGAAAEGEAFIAAWLPYYDRSAVLHGHLAWHQALFALQRDDAERALAIYEDAVAPKASSALPLFTVIDGASFALRSMLHGHPLPSTARRDLAAYAARHFPKAGVPFANAHLAMAYSCASDEAALAQLRDEVVALLEAGRQASGAVVLRVCDAIGAYAAGDLASAAALLDAALPELERMGGSHAQRDVFTDLAIVAHCAANSAKARAIAERRWTQRAGHLNEEWFQRLRASSAREWRLT